MTSVQTTSNPADIGLDAARLDRANRLLSEWCETGDPILPGAVLLAGRGDVMLQPRCFGRQGAELGAPPLEPDHIFPLASITKPIVALTLLQLIEEGAVCMNDLVGRHLPRFPANGKQGVRVVHLLTHTSGLPENLTAYARLRRTLAPAEEYLEEVYNAGLNFPPGTELTYSNPGYIAVAAIVEQVVGRPIGQVLHDRVFTPLGMVDSALGVQTLDANRLVGVATAGSGYDSSSDWNSPYWTTLGASWGGMYSTATDLGRLAAAILQGRKRMGPILSPTTLRLATENLLETPRLPDLSERARRRERWGLGWKLNSPTGSGGSMVDLLGDQVFGHQGVTGTVLWIDPKTELYCVLLTSAGGVKAPWRMASISNIVASAAVA